MHVPAIADDIASQPSEQQTRREAAISRREWRWVLLFAALVVVVTTLPYLAAWNAQGDDWRFSGFLFGVEDGYSYLGKMRLGARGLWDFHLFYTPEPHEGAPLLFLPYLLPGQLVGLLLDRTDPALTPALALAYHIMRVAFDALLILTLYRFIALFTHQPVVRGTALLLATLGGGLGWLLALSGAGMAPEFYIPEGFSFLILFGLPHLALARAALLGGLIVLIEVVEGQRALPHLALAALCWLVVGLAVPFYLVIVYMIIGAWGLALWLRRRAFPKRLAIAGGISSAISLPLFAYYGLLFSSHPAFAQWSAQNQLPSPPPLHYLLAYLVLLLPAWTGWRFAWRHARLRGQFALLAAWPLVGLPLVYLPMNVQRRLGEGVIVPLAILAALGLYVTVRGWALKKRQRPKSRFRRLALALVAVASLSNLMLYLGSWGATKPRAPLFRSAAEVSAFDWLNAHATPDAIVLSAVPTGNALPAYADVRTYMGHGPETLDWPAKTDDVQRFFDGGMPAADRATLLAAYDIAYIFYGPAERALAPAPDADPPWAAPMRLVYDADGYRIYAVATAD